MRHFYRILLAALLLVLLVSCSDIEIRADKVGLYTNDYQSVIPSPTPKKVVISKEKILLVYKEFTLPFRIVDREVVNTIYQRKAGEPDSMVVIQYTMVHPYLGSLTHALLFDKYDNGDIVARELGLEVNYPNLKNPVLAFVEEGYVWR